MSEIDYALVIEQQKQRSAALAGRQLALRKFGAILGNESGVVRTGETHMVYVRLATGQVTEAFNNTSPETPGLPVWVGYDALNPETLQVLGVRQPYDRLIFSPTAPHAADTHEWPGADTLWTHGEQFLPGLITPYSGMVLQIHAVNIETSGGWTEGAITNYDFTSHIPSAGQARWVLVEQSLTTGALTYTNGTAITGGPLQLQPSDIPASSGLVLGAVRCYYGMTEFPQSQYYNDILDLRWTQTRSESQTVAVKTANYTLTATDSLVVFTTGSCTLTISGVASLVGHAPWTIANESTTDVTIDAGASATLKGERYQTLPPGSDIIIRCYQTNKFT